MEESEVLKTKYQGITSGADKDVQRLENIIVMFNEFEKPTKALELWVRKKDKEFGEKAFDLSTPHISKLEKELEELKVSI